MIFRPHTETRFHNENNVRTLASLITTYIADSSECASVRKTCFFIRTLKAKTSVPSAGVLYPARRTLASILNLNRSTGFVAGAASAATSELIEDKRARITADIRNISAKGCSKQKGWGMHLLFQKFDPAETPACLHNFWNVPRAYVTAVTWPGKEC